MHEVDIIKSFERLSDELLLQTKIKAVALQLDSRFIELLDIEMNKRNLKQPIIDVKEEESRQEM
ncbi:sporulation histidine kinase inhibitor Sda [Alkalihalobacillus sp. MEB130]|uniref:sporulation histidine kinase inhibitor Sda n=1 Tax=Alkalihalobacillus sp. MEB130 TaxID=2976704 RepID=UPI0028E04D22|nr:sporulation histidine kinase inhibitor Sda [Alkalihalobacillus sp. MEB130]MDT8858840.1 sporulation histidine kinase inhibitor Sda [Alkalihalobacillus sp. MEB130]